MLKKIVSSKAILVTIGFIIAILAFYLGRNQSSTPKAPMTVLTDNKLFDIRSNQNFSITTNIPEPEANKIGVLINNFENYKYQKDFVGAIGMLTSPQTPEEKSWLDHLLGNDLASINNDKPSPRFLDKANFHIMAGYETENITKKSNIYYASIKEIRFINSVKEDGDTPNYVLQTQDLTFELVNNQGVFQISKYYHTNPTSTANLKYEGFVAY